MGWNCPGIDIFTAMSTSLVFKPLGFFIALLLSSASLFAQAAMQAYTQAETQADMQAEQVADITAPPTLSNQFESMVSGSGSYQEYKVIKKTSLAQFRKVLEDSLALVNQEDLRIRQELSNLEARMQDLEGQLSGARENISGLDQEKNQIRALGVNFSKSSFLTLVAVLLALLLASTAYFFSRFQSRNRVTAHYEKLHKETQDEFEQFKKRAIEREQKLKRELQDELNKRS